MTYVSTALMALADPTRRAIFEQLGDGRRSVGALARGLPISRPAVSQDLKQLKEAGLVTDPADRPRRLDRVDPAGPGVLRQWLDRFRYDALAAFKAEADADAHGETEE